MMITKPLSERLKLYTANALCNDEGNDEVLSEFLTCCVTSNYFRFVPKVRTAAINVDYLQFKLNCCILHSFNTQYSDSVQCINL